MLLHIGLFPVILLIYLYTGKQKGERSGKAEARKLFLVTAMTGNLLGLFLSMQGRERILEPEEYAIPKGDSSYTEELVVYSENERYHLELLIPQREESGEESGEKESAEERHTDREMELQYYIRDYNAKKGDPDYYYLPEDHEEEILRYGTESNSDGMILASLAFLASAAMGILKGQEEEKEKRRHQEQMLLDYPGFVMKFTLLLSAGLSARHAFERMAADYRKEKRKKEVYENVILTCREMESGVPEIQAYRRFGERCGQIRYRTFSVLLAQNLRSGGRMLTDLLEKESLNAWEERRRQVKVLGEKTQTRLLLPMGMMLVLVLAVIMIPAFLNL